MDESGLGSLQVIRGSSRNDSTNNRDFTRFSAIITGKGRDYLTGYPVDYEGSPPGPAFGGILSGGSQDDVYTLLGPLVTGRGDVIPLVVISDSGARKDVDIIQTALGPSNKLIAIDYWKIDKGDYLINFTGSGGAESAAILLDPLGKRSKSNKIEFIKDFLPKAKAMPLTKILKGKSVSGVTVANRGALSYDELGAYAPGEFAAAGIDPRQLAGLPLILSGYNISI